MVEDPLAGSTRLDDVLDPSALVWETSVQFSVFSNTNEVVWNVFGR